MTRHMAPPVQTIVWLQSSLYKGTPSSASCDSRDRRQLLIQFQHGTLPCDRAFQAGTSVKIKASPNQQLSVSCQLHVAHLDLRSSISGQTTLPPKKKKNTLCTLAHKMTSINHSHCPFSPQPQTSISNAPYPVFSLSPSTSGLL